MNNQQNQAAFQPFNIGPLNLRNRLIKSATNEGMVGAGEITPSLVEFHRRMAAGGVGMTTLAYCAISPDGRTFVDQPSLNAHSVAGFRRLTDAVHAEGAAACAQITHGGAFNFLPELMEHPRPVSADGGFNPPGVMAGRWFKRAASLDDMERLCDEFCAAARTAREAGFDAVEIHMGHGYLLSQFLSPAYNHRKDEFGGDAASRARFPCMVLERVLDAVGSDMAVLCKLSVVEGHAQGNTLSEMVEICQALERSGAHMLVLSAGMNVEAPWTIFGSPLPMKSMTAAARGIFKYLSALMALRQPRKPFEPLYLLPYSTEIRKQVKLPLCYLGGVTAPEHLAALTDVGFDAVAMGRVLIHKPELIQQWQAGNKQASGCTACNLCVAQMYSSRGTHCVLTDQPVAANFSVS
ncbi:MAG: NADH:flavin oxidoreductase [Oceanococcus sp.]